MSFATPKRVHFNREVSKFSLGSKTPTVERLMSTSNAVQDTPRRSNNTNQQLPPPENNLITVAVRVRPITSKEQSQGLTNALRIDETNKEIILNDRTNKTLTFTSDHIITDQTSTTVRHTPDADSSPHSVGDSQQQYVYECIGKPLLDRAFDGYNVSIFAYGQTGSGKTYSMIGTDKQPGLIPRFLEDLFTRKASRDQVVSNVHIQVSYYEIYNEKIYDLLRSDTSTTKTSNGTTVSRNLQIRENPQTGPYIVDLLKLSANSAADAKTWLDIGNKRRATACTNMNQKSSRSHSVFQIHLTQILEHTRKTGASQSPESQELLQEVTSRIDLIDLAGSERINNSLGTGINHTPQSLTQFTPNANNSRFKESTCINKSLLTLGKIICLLSERQNNLVGLSGNDNNAAMINSTNGVYLPYRESVLTWLLKESLGGNAKTAMLATINASSGYIDETVCTLRYAAKTACIKNVAHLNRNFKQKYINEFGQEVEMNLMLAPMCVSQDDLNRENNLLRKNDELQLAIKQMEQEWKDKLDEAERLKQKEINDLEKSLLVLYENETRSQNCCLINLNEDPSLSEKLIYILSKSDSTLVGSDKHSVNIHICGPLIAPIHARIYKNSADEVYYLEQMDENYVTYLNGELVNNRQEYGLNHGDRIIFGGSHFFRFNNPRSMVKDSRSSSISSITSTSSAADSNQFKDYQFAKNEIERKQNELIQAKLNEALNKCKQDGDLKLKELELQYKKDIQTYVSILNINNYL